MRITPAEAAIIGTSLGATATLSAAWITQRATSRRERERRLWDRRVATYDDLMSTVHTYAQLRAHTRRSFDLPELREDQKVMPVALRVCPDPEQAPARAALAATQLLGLALTRYVLRFPPTVALTREEVVAWLAPTLQRYLTAPSP